METWKNYNVPTDTELFWMIPQDEDLPHTVTKYFISKTISFICFLKLLPLPDGISIDPSEDYLSNEDGQRVSY